MSRKKGGTITADYVNDLLHQIASLKNRVINLEEVDRLVRRLVTTATVDDDFIDVSNELATALRRAARPNHSSDIKLAVSDN